MNRFFVLLLVFSIPAWASAQAIDTLRSSGFTGVATIAAVVPVTADSWDVTVSSGAWKGSYDEATDADFLFTQISVGDNFFTGCTLFRVQAVADPVPGTIKVLTVERNTGLGAAPGIGNNAALFARTGGNNLPRFSRLATEPGDLGMSKEDLDCLLNDLVSRLELLTGGGASAFDWNRPILRTWSAGLTIGGSELADGLEWLFFTAPSLSLSLSPTTTVYEVGDTNYITVSGTTSNPGGAILTNGELARTAPSSLVVDAFGTGTSYSFAFSFYPQKDSTSHYKQSLYSFQANQDWEFGSESGNAVSATNTVQAVFPVLYGMSATDWGSDADHGSAPYVGLSKLVQTEGNKTVSLTGSGYIYYAVPKTWGDFDLSQIIDHNGFNVTPSFTAYDVQISSSGLINDWVGQDYKLYKLNTTTVTAGYSYQFIR